MRIIVGVDPSGTKRGDEAGVVAAGLLPDGTAQVIEDNSDRMSPNEWATEAVSTYHRLEADLIVAEVNFGGDMVIDTIEGVDPHVRVEAVRASRGKSVRADPVVAKYEQKKVFHSPGLLDLEREQLAVESDQHLVARTDRRLGVRPHRPADPRRRPAGHCVRKIFLDTLHG